MYLNFELTCGFLFRFARVLPPKALSPIKNHSRMCYFHSENWSKLHMYTRSIELHDALTMVQPRWFKGDKTRIRI